MGGHGSGQEVAWGPAESLYPKMPMGQAKEGMGWGCFELKEAGLFVESQTNSCGGAESSTSTGLNLSSWDSPQDWVRIGGTANKSPQLYLIWLAFTHGALKG